VKYIIFTGIALLLFTGCMSQNPHPVKRQIISKNQDTNTTQVIQKSAPPPVIDEKALKEVEDTNYNDDYMYPQAPVKKVVQPASAPLARGESMGREECIVMISQEKFDKYTAMFGSEDASIKRCNMIRSMNQ
jgi:hypothetical protein